MPRFVEIGQPVPGEKIFERFYFLTLIGQAVSEKKIIEQYGNIHVYCLGDGDRTAPVDQIFRIINLQSICPFP